MTPKEWIISEQESLWHELLDAIRSAANGVWSIRCDNIVYRLVGAARVAGPAKLGSTPWPLEASGAFHIVYAAAEVEVPETTEEEWRGFEDLMGEEYGTRDYHRASLALTLERLTQSATEARREFAEEEASR